MGLPCYHIVLERLANPGHILPEDIHPFWWYKRPKPNTASAIAVQTLLVILNPAVVRGKGRPRGSKNKEKGHGVTATRRDPSQFEYVPSSSAPAVLSRPQAESAAVQDLLAHHEQEEQDNGGFIDIDEFDEAMIDPQLRSPQL